MVGGEAANSSEMGIIFTDEALGVWGIYVCGCRVTSRATSYVPVVRGLFCSYIKRQALLHCTSH